MTRMVISLRNWNCRFNESVIEDKELNTENINHIENGAPGHRFLFCIYSDHQRDL